eukprot:scaffold6858_cov112-Isochrysis_galbana.AAC.7
MKDEEVSIAGGPGQGCVALSAKPSRACSGRELQSRTWRGSSRLNWYLTLRSFVRSPQLARCR